MCQLPKCAVCANYLNVHNVPLTKMCENVPVTSNVPKCAGHPKCAELIRTIHSNPLVGIDEDHPEEILRILPAVLHQREAYKTMDRDGLLCRVLARHNETSQAFAQNPRYIVNTLVEAEAFLMACMNITRGIK